MTRYSEWTCEEPVSSSGCSSKCAHYTAFSPLKTPSPKKPILSLDIEDLRARNIVYLTIIAAEADGYAHKTAHPGQDIESLEKVPGLKWDEIRRKHYRTARDSSHFLYEDGTVVFPVGSASSLQYTPWTTADFECRRSVLHYRERTSFVGYQFRVFLQWCWVDYGDNGSKKFWNCLEGPSREGRLLFEVGLHYSPFIRSFFKESKDKLEYSDVPGNEADDQHLECSQTSQAGVGEHKQQEEQMLGETTKDYPFFQESPNVSESTKMQAFEVSNRLAILAKNEITTTTKEGGEQVANALFVAVVGIFGIAGGAANVAMWWSGRRKDRREKKEDGQDDANHRADSADSEADPDSDSSARNQPPSSNEEGSDHSSPGTSSSSESPDNSTISSQSKLPPRTAQNRTSGFSKDQRVRRDNQMSVHTVAIGKASRQDYGQQHVVSRDDRISQQLLKDLASWEEEAESRHVQKVLECIENLERWEMEHRASRPE
ncbi:hypothetical protein BDV96DRAFT_272226 [Lophiotrema nucula]|uniref:Uncharacterized protein n=1 Tax=Lophiotrema nucula TaxID=690887 RepID=A0A6A5ZNB7_9PLEO|nr:hypothetical protein BDV96DRAFT_272226 [Lophiotrema nucula]